ncbi:hypothetical protein [Pedobacter hartonius]|nr:hypothetical protein [Pedobacter hartonius]
MKTLVMATLCFFLSVHAQSQKSVSQIKSIRLGQKMPELVLNKIHNYKTTRCDLGDMGFKFMIIPAETPTGSTFLHTVCHR